MGILNMNGLQDNNEKQGVTGAATGNVSTASADLINAENNAFPVTANSQIIISTQTCFDYISEYYTKGDAESSFFEGELIAEETYGGISSETATVTIYKNRITSVPVNYKSVYLRLLAKSGAVGYFSVDDKVYPARVQIYDIDITEKFNQNVDKLDICIYADAYTYKNNSSRISFYTVGSNAPHLVFEYADSEIDFDSNDEYNIKEFNLNEKSSAYLNLNSGALTTTFYDFGIGGVLPVKISHVHRLGTGESVYGNNWRLNLGMKLKVAENDTNKNTSYLFTDELGDEYAFSEKYYYFDNGRRVFIAKSEVTININGELSYSGNPVYKHQSCRGYTLIPEINDYISSDLIEQRQSEQIELEEFINSCEASLINYVKVDAKTCDITDNIDSLAKESVDLFFYGVNKESSEIIMQRSEAIQLKLIFLQANQTMIPVDADASAEQIEAYNDSLKMRDASKTQFNCLVQQARKNLPLVKDAFLKYFRKKAELEQLVLQSPVNFLKDEKGVISGFNKQGNLVLICDSYGNYVNIIYDIHGRVSSIYDSNNKTMQFEYVNNLLQSITDGLGRTVKYQYDGDNLFRITYPDGETTTLEYILNNLTSIKNSDGKQFKMSYVDNKLTELTKKRYLADEKEISKFILTYSDTTTEIRDDEGNIEYYEFDEKLEIKTHKQRDNRRFYTETTYSKKTVSNKTTKTVITRSAPDFIGVPEVSEYNELNQLVYKLQDWHNISDKHEVRIENYYEYDINGRLIREKMIKRNNGATSHDYTFITNYNYNAQGSLVLTESYIEGMESIKGKNYEQRVYDKNGNLTKTIRWNSLDSSSKFYSESDYTQNGQVASDRDETGEISAEYNYLNGTNVVNSVKYANGSTFAYGRHPQNFNVTSVTQSTVDGESNTTDIVYEDGRLAEVKSGNTIISYTYDQLDRKTSVKINNVMQTEYSYEGYKELTPDDYQLEKCTKTLQVDGGSVKSVYLKQGYLDTDENRLVVDESLTVDEIKLYQKNYNVNGEPETLTYLDGDNEKTVNYTCDSFHNITKAEMKSGEEIIATETYSYSALNELSYKSYSGAVSQNYSYTFNHIYPYDLLSVSFNILHIFKPHKDIYGRYTGREITFIGLPETENLASEQITYRKVGDHATNMPATVWFGSNKQIKDSIKYRYDKCGNISEILENGHTSARYEYDKLNRLIREDNKPLNRTTVYTYDQNGNITERCEYAYTWKTSEELSNLKCTHASYDYEGDRLISYNGENCAYNNAGNPNEYRGKQVLWQYGTRLTQLGNVMFAYDGLGRRTRKGTIQYLYDNENNLIYQSNGLEFIYDTTGVAGIKYQDNVYFYRKDAQGNIVAILDSAGIVVVKYNYDAWGRHNITDANGEPIMDADHIAYLNPFRYRGYYYDTETRLYYLQTRYYDPEAGRFLSQDNVDYTEPEVINGINLYAYCGNNPVMNVDPTGTSFLLFIFGVLLAGAIIGGAVAGSEAAKNGATGWEVVGQVLLGAAFGVAIAGGALMIVAGGMAIAGVTLFGGTAAQIFAIGAAAFNILPMIVAPIVGITAPAPIEYNPNPYIPVTPMPPYTTISMSVNNRTGIFNIENILKTLSNSGRLNYVKISRQNFTGM